MPLEPSAAGWKQEKFREERAVRKSSATMQKLQACLTCLVKEPGVKESQSNRLETQQDILRYIAILHNEYRLYSTLDHVCHSMTRH